MADPMRRMIGRVVLERKAQNSGNQENPASQQRPSLPAHNDRALRTCSLDMVRAEA
jgi:hypothetical protein